MESLPHIQTFKSNDINYGQLIKCLKFNALHFGHNRQFRMHPKANGDNVLIRTVHY